MKLTDTPAISLTLLATENELPPDAPIEKIMGNCSDLLAGDRVPFMLLESAYRRFQYGG